MSHVVPRSTAASVLLITAAACAPGPSPLQREAPDLERIYAEDTARPGGFVPNPGFVAPPGATLELPGRGEGGATWVHRAPLRTEGEIIVIEGDARTVTSNGVAFGITEENTAAIIQEVLAVYPDELDTIQIYLSFPDEAHAGSAYYQSISNSVAGIGIERFDNRGAYGLPPGGRLSGFSNMNDMRMWGDLDQLDTAEGYYYAVIAQELSHRWLMVMKFVDGSGAVSDAFLGRQEAHWSALVHAYGSCQDGVFWIDNGDGTFTHDGESDRGWSPADQYAMGIRSPAEVEDFFYLVEATLDGQALDANSHRDLPRRSRVQARKISVGARDIVAALGPRDPPVGTESPYYRAAFVLVTAPGQPEAEWRPYLETLTSVAATFPDTWKTWTSGKGALCTQVTERCPEPIINLESARVQDGGDGDLAPGEAFELEVAIRNDGLGTTRDVAVRLEAAGPGVEVRTSGAIVVPAVSEGSIAALPARFQLAVGSEVECGGVVRLALVAETQEGPDFRHALELPVGTRTLDLDRMNDDADWTVNPTGADTAEDGAWALDQPELVSVLGVVTQPAGDHSPGEAKLAFFTGPKKERSFSDNDVDNGRTALESPVYGLADARDPTLVFYAWHVALDFTKTPPEPVEGGELVVSATNDGGESWVELGRVAEQTTEWTRVELRIRDAIVPTNRTRFRFEIEDSSLSGIVEAGIDDLEIIDFLDACELDVDRPDGGPATPPPGGGREEGCACAVASGELGVPGRGEADRGRAALLLLLLAGGAARARRSRGRR